MTHLLEFAKFKKQIDTDFYYQKYSSAKCAISHFDVINNTNSGSEIILHFDFEVSYSVEIIFNIKEFDMEVEYFDEFVLTDESQNKLINYILNNRFILDEVEEIILKNNLSTSIEEFKELLKKPKIIIYES